MTDRKKIAARLATAGACALGIYASGCASATTVEVTTLHPAPRALAPRPVSAIQTLDSRPDGGVVVYNLVASGSSNREQELAIRTKAASLGCDGIVITVRAPPSQTQGEVATGGLNAHREAVSGHVTALCVVMAPPAPATPS